MRIFTRGPVLAALVLVLGLSACFKLARTSPPVQRYVLGGATLTSQPDGLADSAALSIGLRRLDLAPYLATLAIVVRRANNEILSSGFHRWAESPTTGVNRAVSGYLSAAPGIRSVDVAPWPIRSEHDYVVQIHVTRFEGVDTESAGAGEAHLLSRWEIIRPADGALMARGVTTSRAEGWAVDDYSALVTRLDNALLQLSQEVLGCLKQLGPSTPMAAIDTVGVTALRSTALECTSKRP